MNIEGMVGTESKSAWAETPIKILKAHAHPCIIGMKSTKFQMNPMKDVEGVEETRPTKHMSAWAITPSKIVQSKILNHMHVFVS